MKYLILALIALSSVSLFAQEPVPAANEALLNVVVSDFHGNPEKGHIIIFEGTQSGQTYTGVSGSDGRFSIIIPKGDVYQVKYREFTSEADYAEIEIPAVAGQIVMDVTIQIELPQTYILDNVFFDTGKSTLKPSSYDALNALLEVMQLKETLIIEIAGHTDNVGGEELNLRLSKERANAVRNYLIQRGVADNRVQAKGYGYTRPIADNDTEQGRAKNRRTEVRVLSE